jgi:hypothetical protein
MDNTVYYTDSYSAKEAIEELKQRYKKVYKIIHEE